MRSQTTRESVDQLSITDRLRQTLRDVLAVPDYLAASLVAETALFGALPELDSMAVATLLTEIEDRFHIVIDDDDVDADTFETFGTLSAFVEGKAAARS